MKVTEVCKKCKRSHATKVYGRRVGESYSIEVAVCGPCKERGKEIGKAEAHADAGR